MAVFGPCVIFLSVIEGGILTPRQDTILLTPSGDPALAESGLAKIIEDLAVGGGATDGAGVPGSPGNASVCLLPSSFMDDVLTCE